MPIKYDNVKLREPGLNIALTPDQLMEMVKCARDVKYFAGNYYKVIHPLKGEMTMQLYDYQEEMLDHFQNNMHSLTCSARQMGKDFSLDTLVLTPTGHKKLHELNVGDTIYGGDGEETHITYMTDTFTDNICYSVVFNNGETIIAGEDHLWRIWTLGQEQVLSTKEIIPLLDTQVRIKLPPYIDIKPFGLMQSSDYIDFISITQTASVPTKCLQVNNATHTFLIGKTNIPTHNTTCSSLYLLWYAIFNKDKTLAILANKQDTAASVIDDIKKAYEGLPIWMKPGVKVYNSLSVEFENGTKIFARATSENSIRGESVSVLFCLGGENTVKLRNKKTGEIREVSLEELATNEEYR